MVWSKKTKKEILVFHMMTSSQEKLKKKLSNDKMKEGNCFLKLFGSWNASKHAIFKQSKMLCYSRLPYYQLIQNILNLTLKPFLRDILYTKWRCKSLSMEDISNPQDYACEWWIPNPKSMNRVLLPNQVLGWAWFPLNGVMLD